MTRPAHSHPYSAGYRTPPNHQYLVLALSALAGCIVAGLYMWAALPLPHVTALHAHRGIRHTPDTEIRVTSMVACVLWFGTTYATGMALDRCFGDTKGYQVVSATAGQHMPLLLLAGGGMLAGFHGSKILLGSGRGVDWFMLAAGIVLLAFCARGFYRALVVHREYYRRFYGSR